MPTPTPSERGQLLQELQRDPKERTCKVCGAKFLGLGRQLYCSPAHRVAAYRRRKKELDRHRAREACKENVDLFFADCLDVSVDRDGRVVIVLSPDDFNRIASRRPGPPPQSQSRKELGTDANVDVESGDLPDFDKYLEAL
jgi:hypothetical protein